MVLQDVGALTDADQHRLLDWLDRGRGRTQVISTTPTPLLSRVQAGAFRSDGSPGRRRLDRRRSAPPARLAGPGSGPNAGHQHDADASVVACASRLVQIGWFSRTSAP